MHCHERLLVPVLFHTCERSKFVTIEQVYRMCILVQTANCWVTLKAVNYATSDTR